MLQRDHCLQRQRRLLGRMAGLRLDAVVVASAAHVYYLSGFLTGWLHQSAMILFADGQSLLITANTPAAGTAAERVEAYPAQLNATQRPDQPQLVAAMVAEALSQRRAAAVGMDASAATSALSIRSAAKFTSIEPELWQLRRIKDPDELALMRRSIQCTQRMYERARDLIEPGVPELEIYNALHAAAVEAAAEPLSAHLGNDYQCASIGGPPRAGRAAGDGELYILDLGPCYRGYFADNARTIAVNRRPTDEQYRAWQTIMEAHEIVQRLAKPGARCQDLYNAVDAHYRQAGFPPLPHHLGHGVGLQPHESPHLNLHWDDVLMEGEVFSAEPGIYSEALRAGIRIENQYLVTSSGVLNLTPSDAIPATLDGLAGK
jgi:Xaa-Pro aminopeptidase